MAAAVIELGSEPRVLEVAGSIEAGQTAEIDAMESMQARLGCAGSRICPAASALRAPARRPRTKNRCSAKNTISGTRIDDERARGLQEPLVCPTFPTARPATASSAARCRRREDRRHEQVVPHPDELEDRERRERRRRQRQDDPEEDLPVSGAVDPRRLDDLARDLGDEVVQQEDRPAAARRSCARSTPSRSCGRRRAGRARGRSCTPLIVSPRENRLSSGTSAIWSGTICSANTSDEEHVLALEVDPRERVGEQRRDRRARRRRPGW